MRSRRVVVFVLLCLVAPAAARGEALPDEWAPPADNPLVQPRRGGAGSFAQLEGQLLLLQLGLDKPGAAPLVLTRQSRSGWNFDLRSLAVAGRDVPSRQLSTSGWGTRLSFGRREGDDERRYELSYLDGRDGNAWGLAARAGHARRWQVAKGLLGLYAGARGEVYSWDVSSVVAGRFAVPEFTSDPNNLIRQVERDIVTTIHQDLTLFTFGLEFGTDWRQPLGPPGLDLFGRARLSPLYTDLDRRFHVRRRDSAAGQLSANRANKPFALGGLADVGVLWSLGGGATLTAGVRFESVTPFGRGANVLAETLYLGLDLAF